MLSSKCKLPSVFPRQDIVFSISSAFKFSSYSLFCEDKFKPPETIVLVKNSNAEVDSVYFNSQYDLSWIISAISSGASNTLEPVNIPFASSVFSTKKVLGDLENFLILLSSS